MLLKAFPTTDGLEAACEDGVPAMLLPEETREWMTVEADTQAAHRVAVLAVPVFRPTALGETYPGFDTFKFALGVRSDRVAVLPVVSRHSSERVKEFRCSQVRGGCSLFGEHR